MPLAVVNKNRDSRRWENKVWVTPDIRLETVAKPHSPENLAQEEFGFGIAPPNL
jgi:hypothetical protein